MKRFETVFGSMSLVQTQPQTYTAYLSDVDLLTILRSNYWQSWNPSWQPWNSSYPEPSSLVHPIMYTSLPKHIAEEVAGIGRMRWWVYGKLRQYMKSRDRIKKEYETLYAQGICFECRKKNVVDYDDWYCESCAPCYPTEHGALLDDYAINI